MDSHLREPTSARSPLDLFMNLKLDTEFYTDCVKHTRRRTIQQSEQITNETWSTQKTIGRGIFGDVQLERRRLLNHLTSSPRQVRAVKVISKAIGAGQNWDYIRELEAIAKFSQSRYAPYFARTSGWFENAESIFIAMEYFPLGNLRRSMDKRLPFSEELTAKISRQLIEGIQFMHESGFAHRNLKPTNILVASQEPQWLVKIADFGISKQTVEGVTALRTMDHGTIAYMAPEAMGFFQRNGGADVTYPVSMDIWAIGIIAAELLLKKPPLQNVAEITNYINGFNPLNLDCTSGVSLSSNCKDFLFGLLRANPRLRPNATDTLKHRWLLKGERPLEEPLLMRDNTAAPSVKTEDTISRRLVRNSASIPSIKTEDTHAVASSPSLACSNQQTIGTPMTAYQESQLDSPLISNFCNLALDEHRYFVLRSDNWVDIETSVAHNVWTSSTRVNKMLDKGYRRAGGKVLLFFSIIGSRKFSGVARMTSLLDWENTDEHWLEDNWSGRFVLEWLCLTELSFDLVKNVPVKESTPGFRAISCYDGTEIATSSAYRLLVAFSSVERENLTSPNQALTT